MKKQKYNKRLYRVFISYRGGDNISAKFAEKLHEAIDHTPNSIDYFGNVFFSPSNPLGNFKNDIPYVMKGVEYFVIPYFNGFFDDFLNKDGSPNMNSITRLEIEEALKNHCKYFIPVYLDGTRMNFFEVSRIFGENASTVMCGNQIPIRSDIVDEGVALAEVVDRVYSAIKIQDIKKCRNSGENLNVYMSFKKQMEDSNSVNYHNLHGAKRITLVNIAGTSFISGISVADIYKDTDYLKEWFYNNLCSGAIETDIILINPNSVAASDAVKYKMFPDGLSIPKKEIINKNLESILEFKESMRRSNIRVYLTDIAIPYGIMRAMFENQNNDYMKIDLYSPLIANDGKRPSFYLENKNRKTKSLYEFFSDNIDAIKNQTVEVVRRKTKSWLTSSNIIHRCKLDSTCIEHTRSALLKCINKSLPVEIDLLELIDGTVIVWRDEEVKFDGHWRKISSFDKISFDSFRRESLEKSDYHGEMLTLQELLDLNMIVSRENKRSASKLLIEIKYYSLPDNNDEKIEEEMSSEKLMLNNYVKNITDILEHYEGIYAVHSSNPYVLQEIKRWNNKILIGQIVFDHSKYEFLSNDMREMHKNQLWKNVICPDFISCKYEDAAKLLIFIYAYEHDIPVIGWTVKIDKVCSNPYDALIVECD